MSAAEPEPSARRSWLPYAAPWLVYALLAAVMLQAPGIVSKTNTHDLYVVFDGIWRIFSGQRIFVDFHSPIGIAYFLPYMLLRLVEPFSLVTMFHGNLLVTGALLGLATLTLRQRLPPGLFFLSGFGIVAVGLSPRTADMGITIFSHLAPYNRWCEAATMLAAPLVLLPRWSPAQPTRWHSTADVGGGVVLGLLGLFLFHIKISFFLCVAGLTLTGLLFQTVSLRTVGLALGLCLLVSLLVELTLHLHRPYLADLRMAVQATLDVHGAVRFENDLTAPLTLAGYLLAAGVLAGLTAPASAIESTMRGHLPLFLFVTMALGLAAAANFQIAPQAEIPLMGAITLVLLETLRRRNGWASGRAVPRAIAGVMVLGLVAAIPAVDAMATVLHGVQSRTQGVCPLPVLRGTTGEQLLFTRYALRAPRAGSCASLTDRSLGTTDRWEDRRDVDMTRLEVARLTDTFHLLKARRVAPGAVVLPLDFANPVSAFTGSPSPRGALLWWDLGRNYSSGSRPDPVRLIGGADVVLQSLYDPPLAWERHGENAWTVYGPEVMRQFQPAAEGRLWRLWARNTAKPLLPAATP